MASFRARLLNGILQTLHVRDAGNRFFHLLYPRFASYAKPTWRQKSRHRVSVREVDGRAVYQMAPRYKPGRGTIFYLHGGAYFSSFLSVQWDFIDRLVSACPCVVVAPDFPLAPAHRVDDIFAMVLPLYRELAATVDPATLTILGDSSGGGLGLALVQKLRDEGLPLPRNLLLLSPWLDVTMCNPEIREMEKNDPYLGVNACMLAGQRYAGSDDPRRPMISPLYGTLDGLCPIDLFVGTHDLMLPDCRKMKAKADEAGTTFTLHEYPKMLHDWMMLRLPESQQALNEIVAILETVWKDAAPVG